MYRLGIDLGGTKIEAALFDEEFSVLQRERLPTPKEYSRILEAVKTLATRTDASDFTIGICTPGSIAHDTGIIKNSNMQALIGKRFADDLRDMLQTDIVMENDANCFALAEATMGAAQGCDMTFGVIMGTGVGGGIVKSGRIHHGRTNQAGEWGHHTLHHNGNQCYCGRKGCVETYISGPALERRWTEMTGMKMSLSEIASHASRYPDSLGTEQMRWKDEFLENFGASLANVIDVLDPDCIVLGGGVSNVPFLYNEGRDAVYRNVLGTVDTPILQNRLGDSAGVFGAAMLCNLT